jgi:hemolysin III
MINHSYREPVSGLTHLFAAIVSILGTLWLVSLTWGQPVAVLVVIIFGLGLLAIYASSSAMHFSPKMSDLRRRLRRYDHAAIYIGIAGSYTPFIYFLLDGFGQVAMFALLWTLACVGVIGKLWYFWSGHKSTLMYLAMGWVGILVAPQVIAAAEPLVSLYVVAGGLVYTVGAAVYALRWPDLHHHFGHHEVWHLFVMGGSTFHFLAVLETISVT